MSPPRAEKLHILFFINSLSGGGAERVTVTLANYWADHGWRVTMVTLADNSRDAYELAPSIRRISLGVDRTSSSLTAALLNNLRRLLALRHCLHRERPDVAIAMMTTANCLLALASRRLVGTTLGSERNFPPHFPQGKFWEAIRRYSYQRLNRVVVQTHETRQWIEENTPAKNVVVVANPVSFPLPDGPPSIAPAEHLDPWRKTMLAVGRIAHEKAYDRLLHAFAKIVDRFPDWDLAIVGDGPLRAELENLAEELGISARVVFPGRVGNVGDWYSATDLFVMTSLSEGFPNVLAEAMAHGLPVVSVDCDTGPRDIICDGHDGILVPQNDHAALVSALGALMEDQVRRADFGRRAIEIRERLSLDRIARQWEELF